MDDTKQDAQEERDFPERRAQMVQEQLARRGISDARVLEAMRSVPRHRFVPHDLRHLAYQDGPLPIGADQTISQPYIVALMTQLLELQGEGAERRQRAREMLEQLGLGELADRRPNELSGGQQQRVAVARAVASRPKMVLADEPTANLDGENAEILLNMMRNLNEQHGITFIFSTHDPRVVAYARRVVRLVDGRVSSDEKKISTTTPSVG